MSEEIMRAIGQIEGQLGAISEQLTVGITQNTSEHDQLHSRVDETNKELTNLKVCHATLHGGSKVRQATHAAVLTLFSGGIGAAIIAFWLEYAK